MIIQIYEERASLYRARFLLFIKHITLILMLCLLPAQANASSLWDQITRFLPFAQDKSETQLSSPEAKQTNKSHSNADGNFDFYVLALSWTPTHCKLNKHRADRQQCGSRPFGFTVHGLWPQFNQGYPEYCQSAQSYVPRNIVSQLSAIMPSAGLIGYQWRKHGSCSGLSQTDYFATLKAAHAKVKIPASLQELEKAQTVNPQQIKNAFLRSNSQLSPNGIAITCRKNHLQEIRICMTKDLEFTQCKQLASNSCASRSLTMPASR